MAENKPKVQRSMGKCSWDGWQVVGFTGNGEPVGSPNYGPRAWCTACGQQVPLNRVKPIPA